MTRDTLIPELGGPLAPDMAYANSKLDEVVALVNAAQDGDRSVSGMLLVMIGQAWLEGRQAGFAAGVVRMANRLRRAQHRRRRQRHA